MTKVLLLLSLIVLSSNIYSQESIVDMFKSKERRQAEALKESQRKEKETLLWERKQPKTNIAKAGVYLENSAKLQAASLSLGAVSSGLLIWYACIDDKFEYKDGDSKLTSKGKGLIASAAVLAVAAISCEIMSVNYKLKAGKCLSFHASGDKVGLALVF